MTKTYYAGPIEAPYQVEAMQYAEDGSNRYTVTLFKINGRHPTLAKPGQWLVKHPDGRVTVQDHEPVWVEKWKYRNETGTWYSDEFPQDAFGGDTERLAILSNDVILPWEEVK